MFYVASNVSTQGNIFLIICFDFLIVLNIVIISFTINMCLGKMKFLEEDEISDYFWDSFKYI